MECNNNIQVEEKDNTATQYDASAACYEITLEEYRHIAERANKFDNKVYIMITFCSIFFAFIINLLEDILKLKNPDNIKLSVLIIIVVVLFITISLGFISSLVLLILCLKPIEMRRFNPSILIGKSLYNKPSKVSYMVATKHYCEVITENNLLLKKGYDKLNLVVKIMVLVVILSFILKIIVCFI